MQVSSNNTKEFAIEKAFTKVETNLVDHLVKGSKILGRYGHEDINQGQISARPPGDKTSFLIKRALCPFHEANETDIMKAPYNENQLADKLAPPELPLHQAIYQIREDVNAIVHTHSYYATLFSAFDWQIEPISHDGACFVNQVAKFSETSNTILDITLGRKVAHALGEAKAIFLQNHGVVITGRSIKEAVVLAVFLEKACKIQLHAKMCNAPYAVSSAEDVIEKQKFIFSKTSINYFWTSLESGCHNGHNRIIRNTEY